MIDQQLRLEVIDLVAEDTGQKTLHDLIVVLSLLVEITDPDLARPRHFLVHVGKAQTAFVATFLALFLEDLGIYEDLSFPTKLPFSWDIDQTMLDVPSDGILVVDILHAGFPSCSICSTVAGFGPCF